MIDAMFCEHANEVPQSCPCKPDCYCKTRTCRPKLVVSIPDPLEGGIDPGRNAVRLAAKLAGNECLRIAFAGASGTGKTTLSTYLSQTFGIPMNPVGSRSVAKAMGFDSPYDVDKAGKRAEFQRRLVAEKRAWEDANESFVVDRTTLDNLAYTMLHDIHCIDDALLEDVVAGVLRYTHIIYCPVESFCNPGDDVARVQNLAYHKLYDVLIEGLVDRYVPMGVRMFALDDERTLEERQRWLLHMLTR
jgi:hypothetical protein